MFALVGEISTDLGVISTLFKKYCDKLLSSRSRDEGGKVRERLCNKVCLFINKFIHEQTKK